MIQMVIKMPDINIFSENIYENWDIDEKFFINIAKKNSGILYFIT